MPICEEPIHIFEPTPLQCGQAVLAMLTGKSVEEVTEACERDNFMTAEEALAFGLVDRVLERH